MSETRQLLVITHLPERASAAERIMTLHADVRDARDLLQKKLSNVAGRHSVVGWIPDPDGIHFDVGPGGRTIVATLQLSRGES